MHSHTDRYARIHARRTLMWFTIDGYTCHYISTAYARFAWCAVSSEKSSNSTADRASVWLSRAACSATRAGCSSGDAVQPNARHVAAKREQSIDETERACTVSTSLPISITEKHAFVTPVRGRCLGHYYFIKKPANRNLRAKNLNVLRLPAWINIMRCWATCCLRRRRRVRLISRPLRF